MDLKSTPKYMLITTKQVLWRRASAQPVRFFIANYVDQLSVQRAGQQRRLSKFAVKIVVIYRF